MANKIKGICKGSFKYISQIFVVKEREMEIGHPTEVKHLAHIGWDGPGGTTPSWMNDFKGGTDLAVAPIDDGLSGSRDNTWTIQGMEQSLSRQTSSSMLRNHPSTNQTSVPKKQKRKKAKSATPTPKSGSSRSSKAKCSRGESEEVDSRHSMNL